MNPILYIDNEKPAFGEWDVILAFGNSSITQIGEANFPDRGRYGIRVRSPGGAKTYLMKWVSSLNPLAGQSLFVGFWLNIPVLPTELTELFQLSQSGIAGSLNITPEGQFQLFSREDEGILQGGPQTPILEGWNYLVLEIRRASASGIDDGFSKLYLNGQAIGAQENLANFSTWSVSPMLFIGRNTSGSTEMKAHFDELRITLDEYPQPYSPDPISEYPSAERTLVLYRQNHAESHDFAKDFCEKSGVPLSNRCPLPVTASAETLPSYAVFQSQIETPLKEWLARHPLIAERCSTLLLGYALPGYFMHEGIRYSAVSRLMELERAFEPGRANPLYQNGPRITYSLLRQEGIYLVGRIDAPTLEEAKTLTDRAADPILLSEVSQLQCENADYLRTIKAQHLRIETGLPQDPLSGALIWAARNGESFSESGEKFFFVDPSSLSAEAFRIPGASCRQALSSDYAAAIGFSDTAIAPLNPETFFEMLRQGATLGEAVLATTPTLNNGVTLLGSPLLQLDFPQGGWNIYAGSDRPETIDWTTPIAFGRKAGPTVEIKMDLTKNTPRLLAVRAVSDHGIEETNFHAFAFAQIDSEGELLPPPLCPLQDVRIHRVNSTLAILQFTCLAQAGMEMPDSFEIFQASQGEFDLNAPVKITPRIMGQNDYLVRLSVSPLSSPWAVRCVKGAQVGQIGSPITLPAHPSYPAPIIFRS
jgi:hypothetical protein